MIDPLGGVGLDDKAAWELAHDSDLAAKHTYCKTINHSKVFFIFFSYCLAIVLIENQRLKIENFFINICI
ncbi:MAG: hypothetical protein II551_00625, partial [Paludibacteraceae bacterium]|nr:hypothetical protein [Paludibacteraceae bacterium]